jgi:hypothetical protein
MRPHHLQSFTDDGAESKRRNYSLLYHCGESYITDGGLAYTTDLKSIISQGRTSSTNLLHRFVRSVFPWLIQQHTAASRWSLVLLLSYISAVCLAEPSVTVASQSSSTSSAPAQTHTVQVALADHKFQPDVLQAGIGDVSSAPG